MRQPNRYSFRINKVDPRTIKSHRYEEKQLVPRNTIICMYHIM